MSSLLKRPAKRELPPQPVSEQSDPSGERVRSDANFPISLQGLDNARTRIVGYRTGFLADLIVSIVRFVGLARSAIARYSARITSVVTPLGWVVLAVIPTTLIVGYSIAWMELIVVGYASIAVALMAAIYLFGRSQLAISLNVERRRVVVGEALTGEVRGVNGGKR